MTEVVDDAFRGPVVVGERGFFEGDTRQRGEVLGEIANPPSDWKMA